MSFSCRSDHKMKESSMKIHEAVEIIDTLEAQVFSASQFLSYISEPTRHENTVTFYKDGQRRTISLTDRGFTYGYFRTTNPKLLTRKIISDLTASCLTKKFQAAMGVCPDWVEIFK